MIPIDYNTDELTVMNTILRNVYHKRPIFLANDPAETEMMTFRKRELGNQIDYILLSVDVGVVNGPLQYRRVADEQFARSSRIMRKPEFGVSMHS